MNIFKRFNIYKIFQSTAFPFAISVFYFKAKGLGMGDILLLESVYALVVVLMEVPSGIFSDIIGKRKALYLANILRLVSHIGFVFGSSFHFFILVHITYGLAQTLFSGTDSALLHDYVEDSYKDKPEDIRQKNYIRLEGSSSMLYLLTLTVTSFIGSSLMSASLAMPYVLSVMAAVISLFLLFYLPEPHKYHTSEKVSTKKFLHESFSELKGNSELIGILFLSGFLFFVFRAVFFLSQEYFSKLYFSASVGGIIITLASIVAAWGSFKAQLFIKKFGETKTHLIIGLLYLVCPLAMAWGHPILGIASFGILGFGRGLSMPVFRSSVVSRVCKRKKATFISLMNLFGYLLFAIASPILGKISDTQGVHVALGACFIISVIGMSLVIFIPKIKKLLIPSPIKAGVPVHEV